MILNEAQVICTVREIFREKIISSSLWHGPSWPAPTKRSETAEEVRFELPTKDDDTKVFIMLD